MADVHMHNCCVCVCVRRDANTFSTVFEFQTRCALCLHVCVTPRTHTACSPGAVLLLLSRVQMEILFIINKSSLSFFFFFLLLQLILLTFLECSTFKSSCCILLFTFS